MSKQIQILDQDGRPVSSERRKWEKQYRGNPLRNWTPDVLARQIEAWSHGDLRQLAYVMDWVQQYDDICSTVAAKAIGAVSRHGFDIIISESVDKEQMDLAEKQREVLQDFYNRIECSHAMDVDLRGGMRLLVAQVMDGFAKGYATHHVIWKPTAQGLTAELQQVPLWFFEARSGSLQFLATPFGYEGVPLKSVGGEHAWMISRGRGVMHAAVIARMFKQIPLQDWLTYCDRHGMPGFLGKTSERKGSEGWDNMRNAVSSMGAEYAAVVNTGDVIEVLDLTAQGNIPYPTLVERMDRATAMLWRGGDLSTISQGGGGVGASVQGEETDDLDADNAAWAGETIDRQLSKIVLEWTFGKDVPQLARLVLRTKTREDTKLEIEKIQAAVALGLNPSRPWVAMKLGITEADGDEVGLGKQAVIDPVAATNAFNPEQRRIPKGMVGAGRWEGNQTVPIIIPHKKVTTLQQAEDEVKPMLNKPMLNSSTMLVATVSQRSLNKMTSDKAVTKSTNEKVHATAVANIKQLWEDAILGESRAGERSGDINMKQLHRYYAPLKVDDGVYRVKITVKEMMRSSEQNKIYSVEALEIESPAGLLTTDTTKSAVPSVPLTGDAIRVKDLLPAVNEHFAINAALDPTYIEEAILRTTQIRAAELNKLTAIIDELLARAESSDLTEKEFADYAEKIIAEIPDSFDAFTNEKVASALANAMGTAMVKTLSNTLS